MKTATRITVGIATVLILLGITITLITLISCGGIFGLGANIVTEKIDITEPIDNIRVDVSSCNVEFVKSTTDNSYVLFKTRNTERMYYTAEVCDGTLEINLADERKWYEYITISGIKDEEQITVCLADTELVDLTANSSSADLKVSNAYGLSTASLSSSSGEVDFSANVSGQLSVNTTSGDIDVASHTIGALTINTSSGEVDIASHTIGALAINTTSGDVDIATLTNLGSGYIETNTGCVDALANVSEELSIKTTSGDIDIESHTIGALTINTSSGEVDVANLTNLGSGYIETTSGDIEVSASSSEELSIKTSSGLVSLQRVFAKSLKCQTSSADIILEKSDGEQIEFITSSGDVRGTLTSNKIFLTKTLSGDIDVPQTRDGGFCEVTTTSGDIRITIAP